MSKEIILTCDLCSSRKGTQEILCWFNWSRQYLDSISGIFARTGTEKNMIYLCQTHRKGMEKAIDDFVKKEYFRLKEQNNE